MTHHPKTLWISLVSKCQPIFLGISGARNFFDPSGKRLLLAWLLFGLGQGGLGNGKDRTQGGGELLKGGFVARHGQHNTTSMLGGLQ